MLGNVCASSSRIRTFPTRTANIFGTSKFVRELTGANAVVRSNDATRLRVGMRASWFACINGTGEEIIALAINGIVDATFIDITIIVCTTDFGDADIMIREMDTTGATW